MSFMIFDDFTILMIFDDFTIFMIFYDFHDFYDLIYFIARRQ